MIFEDEENEELENYEEEEKKPNEGLIIFVTVFFVMVLLFLGIAKHLSPDVDVTIHDDVKTEETDDSREEATSLIDTRLKDIQMEDKGKLKDETFSSELDEKVVLPPRERKTVGEEKSKTENVSPATNQTEQKTVSQTVNAKVVIGYYATEEQAQTAKNIIQTSGLNLQPFVKHIGGAYTLQVGSYNSKEKAQSVANELLRSNYPARVIVE